MKRLIVTLATAVSLLSLTVNSVKAEEVQTCTQVSQYGGGVGIVCGTKFVPAETGLADINPVVLASIFFAFAGIGLYNYKKALRAEVAL